MDYGTFINSAFILQGRVDEFTRKSALERKQILSEVLGLSHYEQLSVLAHRKVRSLDREIIALNASLEQFQKEVSEKDIVSLEIKKIEGEEEKQSDLIKTKEKILQKLIKDEQKLSYEQKQAEEIAVRISTELKELQESKIEKKE